MSPAEQRGAKFMALSQHILPTGTLTCRAVPGKVAFARLAGDYPGFGYDPLFHPR